MAKSKNITQAEIDAAKKEHDKAWQLRKARLIRGGYFTACIANLAVGAYLGILVDGFGINGAADVGQTALAMTSIATALYFAYKTIE